MVSIETLFTISFMILARNVKTHVEQIVQVETFKGRIGSSATNVEEIAEGKTVHLISIINGKQLFH